MKKICVVTGSRADYGIMRPLLFALQEEVSLELVVTGSHLEERFGNTVVEIEKDGFTIASRIPLHLEDSHKETLGKSFAYLSNGLTDLFSKTSYDLILILGDRYEMLPVANVALLYNIPICHLHGGEQTLGNVDEMIRHALSKMSHLHLTASSVFRQRLLQMGELPERVHHIGSLGVENVLSQGLMNRSALEAYLNIDLAEDYLVVLFHPVTLELSSLEEQVNQLMQALVTLEKQVIFIGVNADAESDVVSRGITTVLEKHSNAHLYLSLPTIVYHSLVKHSKGLIGNSSSGLIEVPSLKTPTLNIGNRQAGRLRGPSVIDVPCQTEAILDGIARLETIVDFDNPYYKAGAKDQALKHILAYLIEEPSLVKAFYEGDDTCGKD